MNSEDAKTQRMDRGGENLLHPPRKIGERNFLRSNFLSFCFAPSRLRCSIAGYWEPASTRRRLVSSAEVVRDHSIHKITKSFHDFRIADWDHEPKAPASWTHSKRFAKFRDLEHGATAFGVRGASTLRSTSTEDGCSRFCRGVKRQFLSTTAQKPNYENSKQ